MALSYGGLWHPECFMSPGLPPGLSPFGDWNTLTRAGSLGPLPEGSRPETPQLQQPHPPSPAPPPGLGLQPPSAAGASGTSGAGSVAGRGAAARAAQAKEASADRRTQHYAKEEVAAEARTQVGSKLLQQKLLKGHPTVINDILEGIAMELPDLMCHTYGNYLCSASFQACSVGQRRRMLEIAVGAWPSIAVDKWGTHAMQSLIGLVCSNEEVAILIAAVKEHLVKLACDNNGAHVVQRALMAFGDACPEPVLSEVAKNIIQLAQCPHGVAVAKRCLSQARSAVGQQILVKELAYHAVELTRSDGGSHLLRHTLEELGCEGCRPIFEALHGQFVGLCSGKVSVQIVEIALRSAPVDLQEAIVEELALGATVPCREALRRGRQATSSAGRQQAFEQALAAAAACGGSGGFAACSNVPMNGKVGAEPRRRTQRSRRGSGAAGPGGAAQASRTEPKSTLPAPR